TTNPITSATTSTVRILSRRFNQVTHRSSRRPPWSVWSSIIATILTHAPTARTPALPANTPARRPSQFRGATRVRKPEGHGTGYAPRRSSSLLPVILPPGVLDSLPGHVRWQIDAAVRECDDMVSDPSR